MRKGLALAAFAAAVLSVAPAGVPQGTIPKKPKLVIAIIVDQFRYDYTI
jgi:hypothetical protein